MCEEKNSHFQEKLTKLNFPKKIVYVKLNDWIDRDNNIDYELLRNRAWIRDQGITVIIRTSFLDMSLEYNIFCLQEWAEKYNLDYKEGIIWEGRDPWWLNMDGDD